MNTKGFFAITIIFCVFISASSGKEGRQMANLSMKAGEEGFAGGPVAFKAVATFGDHDVVSLNRGDEPERYAQRDGDEFIFSAPKMAPHETVSYKVSEATDPPVRVSLSRSDHQIDVKIDGRHFTTYHFAPDLKKPFLYPVLLGGKYPLTRGYPMEDIEGEPKDHVHHRSWWVAYGEMNGADFWSEAKDNPSRQVTKEITEIVSGPVFGKIVAHNDWMGPEARVCREERGLYFYADGTPDQTADMNVAFVATDGEVHFGDTKEGGICSLRLNPKIDEEHGNGRMTNSEGQSTAKECWGKPAKWNDYSGSLEGQDLGIAVFDHPSNLRHPTRWHIRDYGLYTANCFGLSYFTEGEDEKLNGDYLLEDGDKLSFRYRLFFHTGDTEEAGVEKRYQAYAAPPQTEIQ